MGVCDFVEAMVELVAVERDSSRPPQGCMGLEKGFQRLCIRVW